MTAHSSTPRLTALPAVLPADAPFAARARAFWTRFPNATILSLLLILITVLGGFLRFWRLDQQSYWYDEGRTIERISGTFDQMIRGLDDQGFPPGWYILMRGWVHLVEARLHHGAAAFTPFYLRIPPAIFGTLLVPAMYFLARQFTDRKGALLVMLLAAINPFLIYYSRDIKMYAACYFFATLHVGLFFQWQTTRRWRWFVPWIVTGAAMTALHATPWFLVGLELLWLLTRPRLKPFDGPLWLLGLGVIALIPVWWYFNKTSFLAHVADRGAASNLGWCRSYTDMTWRTWASLPMVHVLGYLWPVYPPNELIQNWFHLGEKFSDHLDTRALPWLARTELWVALTVGAVMVLGLIPWRGRRQSPAAEPRVTDGRWWWLALWILIPMVALSLTWLDPESAWYRRIWGHREITALWEPRYLGIIVPAWLLWLAASMRRLPTLPVRVLVILGVLTACTLSALSNHLVYRQAPWARTAAALMTYYNPAQREDIVFGTPATAYPGQGDVYTYMIARGERPHPVPEEFQFLPDLHERRTLTDGNLRFIRSARLGAKVLVLTDRNGDLTDGPLTNENIQRILGPNWRLVREEQYRWYYEWRFYIFHTWRTRVWVRVADEPH